jgi:predicted alpha/beta hydrolase
VQRDLPAVLRAARRRHPELGVALVGHSLAGHAGLIAAGLPAMGPAPDAVVAIGANLWMPKLEPSRRRRLAKGGALRLWSAVTAARGYFDPRPLRLGTDAEPAEYVRQLVRFWERDHLASDDGGLDYEQALGRVELSVLSVSSEGDLLLARPAAVDAFMALMPRARRVDRRMRGRGAPDHMGLVIAPRARPEWEALARWIVETIGR